MKKLFLTSLAAAMLFAGCQKNNLANDEQAAVPSQRSCASMEVLSQLMKDDPTLESRMNADELIVQQNMADHKTARLVNGVIEIPVVINVLYRTAAENVSQAQIQSQIDVLNEDYNATNADFNKVPSLFTGLKANVGIRFVLDQVIRKSTNKKSWSANDAMKKSNQGGINPTSPTTKLNIWVCTLGQGLLGYAQFPGGSSATDGVVLLNKGFGRTGTATAPYNLGRSATHEVGHWLNLRHIWGDATCGNDLVSDTPTQKTSNFGCPAFPHKTCSNNGDMSMNYMDYTDDACMYMFSNGQKSRIMATFASGGPRNSFAK
jgi:hypothetical protein